MKTSMITIAFAALTSFAVAAPAAADANDATMDPKCVRIITSDITSSPY